MKFSGKMCLMIKLKVTNDQGFTLSVEDTFYEKPQGEGGRFRVNVGYVVGVLAWVTWVLCQRV